MKIKNLIFIIILVCIPVMAQEESLTNFSWDIGFPVSKANEFLGKESYAGFAIEGRKFISKNTTVGLSIGWNLFDQKLGDPINLGGDNVSGTITGTQIRYINSFPFLVNYFYYFGKRREIRTYVGLNTGVYYILQRLDIGVYRFDSDNWHFGLAPEAGFIFPALDYGATFFISGRYNYAFDSGSSLGGNENNFYTYWTIRIGLSISSRWY